MESPDAPPPRSPVLAALRANWRWLLLVIAVAVFVMMVANG